MATKEIEKLEKTLDIHASDLEDLIGIKKGTAYYKRKNFPKIYQAIIIGIRIMQSPLTIQEVLDQIGLNEKMVGKKR